MITYSVIKKKEVSYHFCVDLFSVKVKNKIFYNNLLLLLLLLSKNNAWPTTTVTKLHCFQIESTSYLAVFHKTVK
jgi:hypothetical protein